MGNAASSTCSKKAGRYISTSPAKPFIDLHATARLGPSYSNPDQEGTWEQVEGPQRSALLSTRSVPLHEAFVKKLLSNDRVVHFRNDTTRIVVVCLLADPNALQFRGIKAGITAGPSGAGVNMEVVRNHMCSRPVQRHSIMPGHSCEMNLDGTDSQVYVTAFAKCCDRPDFHLLMMHRVMRKMDTLTFLERHVMAALTIVSVDNMLRLAGEEDRREQGYA